ncbi:MAG: hypothetical protein ACOCP8_03680 [archaeon]
MYSSNPIEIEIIKVDENFFNQNMNLINGYYLTFKGHKEPIEYLIFCEIINKNWRKLKPIIKECNGNLYCVEDKINKLEFIRFNNKQDAATFILLLKLMEGLK